MRSVQAYHRCALRSRTRDVRRAEYRPRSRDQPLANDEQEVMTEKSWELYRSRSPRFIGGDGSRCAYSGGIRANPPTSERLHERLNFFGANGTCPEARNDRRRLPEFVSNTNEKQKTMHF